jgi:hypothetical protein
VIAPSVAASDYVGWMVLLADGAHVFEAVPPVYGLAQLLPGEQEGWRPLDRTSIEWPNLPHHQVMEVELYAFRATYPIQPIMRITREPGCTELRFMQMKMRGIVVGTGGTRGQERTALAGYRIGYWNPPRREYDLVECTPQHRLQMDPAGGYRPPGSPPLVGHPCWPRPQGLGLAPHVLGLTAGKVPAAPTLVEEDVAP